MKTLNVLLFVFTSLFLAPGKGIAAEKVSHLVLFPGEELCRSTCESNRCNQYTHKTKNYYQCFTKSDKSKAAKVCQNPNKYVVIYNGNKHIEDCADGLMATKESREKNASSSSSVASKSPASAPTTALDKKLDKDSKKEKGDNSSSKAKEDRFAVDDEQVFYIEGKVPEEDKGPSAPKAASEAPKKEKSKGPVAPAIIPVVAESPANDPNSYNKHGVNCDYASDPEGCKRSQDTYKGSENLSSVDKKLAKKKKKDAQSTGEEGAAEADQQGNLSNGDSGVFSMKNYGSKLNSIVNKECKNLKGDEHNKCRERAEYTVLEENCSAENYQNMPEDTEADKNLKSDCAQYIQVAEQQQQLMTEGEVPGDFYQVVMDQGLNAYRDPGLPEERYNQEHPGEVHYPYDICGNYIAKNEESLKKVKKDLADTVLSSAQKVHCDGKGDGNFFSTGQIEDRVERQICEHSRAQECPILNHAFAYCKDMFVPHAQYAVRALNEDMYKGTKQSHFFENLCTDTHKAFKKALADHIMKIIDDAATHVQAAAKLEKIKTLAAGYTSEVKSSTSNEALKGIAASWLEAQTAAEWPEVELDEYETVLTSSCQQSCRKNVMFEWSAEEYLEAAGPAFKEVFLTEVLQNHESPFEMGGNDPLFKNHVMEKPKGLRACGEKAYARRRNVYMSSCTALRGMAFYGTDGGDFASAQQDQETISFDGRFQCRRTSIFTVDYDSCKTLINVYNAGFTAEMLGSQVEQASDMIKTSNIQDRVSDKMAEGNQTAALDGMRDMAKYNSDKEKIKATLHGANFAGLTAAMANFVTANKIEQACASEYGPVWGWRCLEASHILVNENPEYKYEFYSNKHILDQFYGVAIQTFGKSLISGLKAHLYNKQAKAIKEVKDNFVTPDFQDARTLVADDFCLNNPSSQMCNGSSRGRTSRAGLSFSGLSGGNQGGADVNLSNEGMGEYDDKSALSTADKEKIRDLAGLVKNEKSKGLSNDFSAPGAVSAKVGRSGGGGGGGGGGASASGGSNSGAPASAEGGSGNKNNITASTLSMNSKGKGFQTYSGAFAPAKKTDANSPFGNLLNKGDGRVVANIEEDKTLHPKNIGLFDKISARYAKVSEENRLQNDNKPEGK